MPKRLSWLLCAVLCVLALVTAVQRASDDGVAPSTSDRPWPADGAGSGMRTAFPTATAASNVAPATAPPTAAVAFAAVASSPAICAFGPVLDVRNRTEEEHERLHRLIAGPFERLVAALRQRGDAPSNAAGLLLASREAVNEAHRQARRAAHVGCGDDADCAERVSSEHLARSDAGSREVDALLRVAVASRDPFVHAIASEACHGSMHWTGTGPPAACAAIRPAQWAALDPGNAVAWLHAAAAASAAGDASGVDAALLRASRASTTELYGDRIYGVLAAAVPEGASDDERLAAHVVAAHVIAMWTLPPYGAAIRWCDAGRLRDADRRATCGDLAERFGEQGRTLMDLGIGIALARRIDPASARAAAWKERHDALMHALTTPPSEPDSHGCAPLRRERAFLARASDGGETKALSERLAAAGLSQEVAARRFEIDRRNRDGIAPTPSVAASAGR